MASISGFCDDAVNRFGRVGRSGVGGPRTIRRTALATCCFLSMGVFGAMSPLARSGVPDRAEDRLAVGVVKLLSAPIDLSRNVLETLAAKHAEVLEMGDDFWPKTIDAIMSRREVQEALERGLRSNFSDNRDIYLRLTQQLPDLADALAKTIAFDDRGVVDGKPVDEVLRRMRRAPPAAQRALIARAIDPSNGAGGELVERIASFPEIVSGMESYLLDLRSSNDPKARVLAFRYAVARGLPVTDTELFGALDSLDPGAVRAALRRVSSFRPDRVVIFGTALAKIVERSGDSGAWAEALRLLLGTDASAATAIIDRHRGDEAFWLADRGYAALGAIAGAPGSLPALRGRIADLPLKQMFATGRCDILIPAVEIWPDLNPKDTATSLTSLLSSIARSQAGPPCSTENIATVLDAATSRLGTAADRAYAAALSQAANAAAENFDESGSGFKAVRDILRTAQATRRAFASDSTGLVSLARQENVDPLVGALIEALPSDHPALSALRQTLKPAGNASLSDHILSNKRSIVAALHLTARSEGWANQDMNQLALLSSSQADLDVARAAFDDLMLAGYVQGLVDTFDAIMRLRAAPADSPDELTVRAIRAFTRASRVTNDPASLFSRERTGWLLDRLATEGLRGRVVRAFGERPDSATIDPKRLENMLARTVPSKLGSTTNICADAATLGAFSDNRLAVLLLEASAAESFQGEDWLPACVAWLAPANAIGLTEQGDMLWLLALRDGTLETTEKPAKQLDTLFQLWSASKAQALGDLVRRKMAMRAAALAPHMGWGVADTGLLRKWDSELSRDLPDQVWPVRREWLLRSAFLLLLAVPTALFLHLAFWCVLLAAYRKSTRVQTHIFYNPLARKILGFGYVDILLVWIGPLRRLLFAPFAGGMAGDVGRRSFGTKEGPYYPDSQILKLDRSNLSAGLKDAEREALSGGLKTPAEQIVRGLADWKGPTCLFGPSGRGKTSYLRHVLTANASKRTPFVYLRAAECGEDVVSTVCSRFPGLGRDTDLIVSLIRSGILDIYVDGLNEVDRELQERIVRFVVDYPTANVFLSSQEVGIALPTRLATYYLLPLTKEQMREFLLSRETSLDAEAPLRGEHYSQRVNAYLDELSDEVVQNADRQSADPAHPAIVTSFLATLANPMDLDTAAVLLSLDIDPDPFRLQEQQFRLVDEDCRTKLDRPFPISAFSKSALNARQDNKAEIDWSSFGEYVAILEQRKQVRRTTVDVAGGKATSEYRFRHEKIGDFYLHFALLEANSEMRFSLARDDRFAGAFDYLARELPAQAADELKEYLLSAALDSNDHRLSDRFLQHLRWRALLDRDDPTWLARYDTPDGSAAAGEFDRLAALRDRTESDMRTARSKIEASRAGSRILAAKDARSLESAVRELFLKLGAGEIATPGGAAPIFEPPGLAPLALLCIAGPRTMSPVTRIGLASRASRISGRKLVVVNPQAELDPSERDWSQVKEWAESVADNDIGIISTRALYRLARDDDAVQGRRFWTEIMRTMERIDHDVAEGETR
ncbi:hypothetical protein ACNJX9_32740 [Bradyrhizobium sp. DASA03076]|uniref:hypothetical protein n=1 Tax=Bradyrhizobium sp. BLXBL-03 TaxID=3395916 RepID=UPI003F6EE4BF